LTFLYLAGCPSVKLSAGKVTATPSTRSRLRPPGLASGPWRMLSASEPRGFRVRHQGILRLSENDVFAQVGFELAPFSRLMAGIAPGDQRPVSWPIFRFDDTLTPSERHG